MQCGDDAYQLLLAFDWGNIERFADEIPLAESSVVLADPAQGEIPEVIARSGARILTVPLTETAKSIDGGRVNMVGLGVVAGVLGLPRAPLEERICAVLSGKGEASQAAALACLTAGLALATDVPDVAHLAEPRQTTEPRWNISGNEAAGLGVLRAGVRFCAAYPITPATDVLEWLAPNLPRVGGALVQAEDELASINMCIGASFGGTPSVTATSGPGLSLMTEALGLAVASETPLVVIDVMRGGPSTGIPTKSEQSDLNIAVYGLHGDAPHLVLAPNGVDDCLFTAQWAVHLAEQLQTPAIVLSDQFMGQARAVLDRPPEAGFKAARVRAEAGEGEYHRYAVTADGISPMAIPGTPNREYTADGLEHNDTGTPSAQAVHHQAQLEKRSRKLRNHDYGESWADVKGDGEIAVITGLPPRKRFAKPWRGHARKGCPPAWFHCACCFPPDRRPSPRLWPLGTVSWWSNRAMNNSSCTSCAPGTSCRRRFIRCPGRGRCLCDPVKSSRNWTCWPKESPHDGRQN